MWLSLAACYIAIYISAGIDVTTVLNPKFWYSSPAIWQKIGISIWVAFLCDTPFAIVRGLTYVPLFNYYLYYLLIKSTNILSKDKSLNPNITDEGIEILRIERKRLLNIISLYERMELDEES